MPPRTATRCKQLQSFCKPTFFFGAVLTIAVIQLFFLVRQLHPKQVTNSQLLREQALPSSIPNNSSQVLGTNISLEKSRSPHLSSNITYAKGPIFYNLFVPINNLSSTARIVSEQLLQRTLSSPNEPLLYTLIGNVSLKRLMENQAGVGYKGNTCDPSTGCHLRKALEKGDEVNTLQALWEFCYSLPQFGTSQDVLVSYIHDKGSYHPSPSNEKARRMATKGALECRNLMPQAKNPRLCNICMGAFHVFPQYLASAK